MDQLLRFTFAILPIFAMVFVVGVILYLAIRAMTFGTRQAFDMLGGFLTMSVLLALCGIPLYMTAIPWVWDIAGANGYGVQYAKTQMAQALIAPASAETSAPAATDTPLPVVATPTGTPLPAVVPADVVPFPQTEVQLVSGTELTVHHADGSETSVTGPFFACAWKNGWLLGCPWTSGLYFSPDDVGWATAGIPTPQPTGTPVPTATFTPAPTSTMNPTVAAANCENALVAFWQAIPKNVTGAALVPTGYQARLSGPGLIGLAPGNQLWTLEVLDLPNTPSVKIGDDLAKTIASADWNGTIEFTGTGDQCLPP